MGITFKEIGDDCKLCPLHKAMGCNGMANHGNGPVYPPCSEMDEDTDVEAYLEQIRERERRSARVREEKRQKQAQEETKKALQKKRRQYLKDQCRQERLDVDICKKAVAAWENEIQDLKIHLPFARMTDQGGMSSGEEEAVLANLQHAEEMLAELKTNLETAQAALRRKQLEVQKTDVYKNMR